MIPTPILFSLCIFACPGRTMSKINIRMPFQVQNLDLPVDYQGTRTDSCPEMTPPMSFLFGLSSVTPSG